MRRHQLLHEPCNDSIFISRKQWKTEITDNKERKERKERKTYLVPNEPGGEKYINLKTRYGKAPSSVQMKLHFQVCFTAYIQGAALKNKAVLIVILF